MLTDANVRPESGQLRQTYTRGPRWQSNRRTIHSGVNVANAEGLLACPRTTAKCSPALRLGCNTRSREKKSLFLLFPLICQNPNQGAQQTTEKMLLIAY